MATMLRKGRIPVTDVNPHLLCVLCGGYFIDATTIIECLHSYCRTCIVRYLETSKMCPLCDVLVHKTKPLENLRADKTLQDLVYKLVPGLFESEMAKRRKFYEEHPEEVAEASMEDRGEAGMEKTVDYEDEQISLVLELSTNGLPPGSRDEEVADRRYLLCPSAVTIGHLKKFIRLKFLVPEKYQIQFYHTRLELTDNLTLCDIAVLYTWRRIRPLRLFYMIYNPPPNHRKLALTPEEKRRRNIIKRKLSEDTEAAIAERAAKIARKATDGMISSDVKAHYMSIGKHLDKVDNKCIMMRDVNENCVMRQNKDLKNEATSSDGKSRTFATKEGAMSKQTSLFIKPNSPVNGKHKAHHRSSDFFGRSKLGKLDIFAKNSRKSKNSDSSKLLNDTKIVDSMKLLKINKNGDVYKCPSSSNSVITTPVKPADKTPRDKKTLIRPGKNIKVSDVRTHTSPDDVKSDVNKNRVIIDIKRSVTKSPFKFLDTKNTVLVQCSLKNLSDATKDENTAAIDKSDNCKTDAISRDEVDVKNSHKNKEISDVKLHTNNSAKCEKEMTQNKVDKSESSTKSHKQKNASCDFASKDVNNKSDVAIRNNNTIDASKQTEKHPTTAGKSSSDVVMVKHPTTAGKSSSDVVMVKHPTTAGKSSSDVVMVKHPTAAGKSSSDVVMVKHPTTAGKSSSDVVMVKQKKVKSRNSINNIFKVQEDKNNVLAKHKAETEKVAAMSKLKSEEAEEKLKRETTADVKATKIDHETKNSSNMQPITSAAPSSPISSPSAPPATIIAKSTALPVAQFTASSNAKAVPSEPVIVKPRMKKSDFFAKQRIMPKPVDVQPEDKRTDLHADHKADNLTKTDLSTNNKINPVSKTDPSPSLISESAPKTDPNPNDKTEPKSKTDSANSNDAVSKITLYDPAIKPEKYVADQLDANKNDINVNTPETKKEKKKEVLLPKMEYKNEVSNKVIESKNDVNFKLNESKSNIPVKLKSKSDVTVKQCESKNDVTEKLSESKDDVLINKSEYKCEVNDDNTNAKNAKTINCQNVINVKTADSKHGIASKKTNAKNTSTPTKFESQKNLNTTDRRIHEMVTSNSNVTEKRTNTNVSSKIEDFKMLAREIKNDVIVTCHSSSDITTKGRKNDKAMISHDSREVAAKGSKHNVETESHKSCEVMKKGSKDDSTVEFENSSDVMEKSVKIDVKFSGNKNDVDKKRREHVATNSKNDVSVKLNDKTNGVHANSSKSTTKATVSGDQVTNTVEDIEDSALCHHNSLIFKAGFATDPYSFEMDHQPLDLSDVSLKRCVKKSVILNK